MQRTFHLVMTIHADASETVLDMIPEVIIRHFSGGKINTMMASLFEQTDWEPLTVDGIPFLSAQIHDIGSSKPDLRINWREFHQNRPLAPRRMTVPPREWTWLQAADEIRVCSHPHEVVLRPGDYAMVRYNRGRLSCRLVSGSFSASTGAIRSFREVLRFEVGDQVYLDDYVDDGQSSQSGIGVVAGVDYSTSTDRDGWPFGAPQVCVAWPHEEQHEWSFPNRLRLKLKW